MIRAVRCRHEVGSGGWVRPRRCKHYCTQQYAAKHNHRRTPAVQVAIQPTSGAHDRRAIGCKVPRERAALVPPRVLRVVGIPPLDAKPVRK